MTSIGSGSFENCTALTSLSFQGATSLTSIGSYSFAECTDLSSPIFLPSFLKEISIASFYKTSAKIIMSTDSVDLKITPIAPGVPVNLDESEPLPPGLQFEDNTLTGHVVAPVSITFEYYSAIASYYLTIEFTPAPAPCFLFETKLLTIDSGFKQVSKLTKNDLLCSPFSTEPQKIKQIMKREINLSTVEKHNHPLIIKKHYFGVNLPTEDVFLSGNHRIILSHENMAIGIQAFKLVDSFLNEEDVRKFKENDKLFYYHIELEDSKQHLIASNLNVESY